MDLNQNQDYRIQRLQKITWDYRSHTYKWDLRISFTPCYKINRRLLMSSATSHFVAIFFRCIAIFYMTVYVL